MLELAMSTCVSFKSLAMVSVNCIHVRLLAALLEMAYVGQTYQWWKGILGNC